MKKLTLSISLLPMLLAANANALSVHHLEIRPATGAVGVAEIPSLSWRGPVQVFGDLVLAIDEPPSPFDAASVIAAPAFNFSVSFPVPGVQRVRVDVDPLAASGVAGTLEPDGRLSLALADYEVLAFVDCTSPSSCGAFGAVPPGLSAREVQRLQLPDLLVSARPDGSLRVEALEPLRIGVAGITGSVTLHARTALVPEPRRSLLVLAALALMSRWRGMRVRSGA